MKEKRSSMDRFYPLRVARVSHETRDAVLVTLEVAAEQQERFRFLPGQHLTLRTMLGGEEVRRSYSICSAPHEGDLRIAIKRVEGGCFSSWASGALKAGCVVECAEPSGSFHVPLQPDLERHHVAFAAGSGITPILSLLKSTLREEPRSRFTLVYGNRASFSVLFKEELEDLKDRYMERLNLVFLLSREQQDVELFNGRIDRAKCDRLLRCWIDPRGIDVAYLCGPQSMMEDVSASLEAHGVARERVKRELFGTAERSSRRSFEQVSAPGQACRITVVQDGRERAFSAVRNGKTILESALEQGFELPYSCKAGVCSTCRCKLFRGEVDMDASFALEDYEVARGFILTCRSYARTPEIGLDYDQGI